MTATIGFRPARTQRPRRDEHGLALVLVLLVLLALTGGAVGLMRSSSNALQAAGREVSHGITQNAADAALASGLAWYGGQQVLGAPPRTNVLSISDPAARGYWNFRNYGGIGDSSTSVVTNWAAITPDIIFDPSSPRETQVWFAIAREGGSVRVNRSLGQEAGRGVRHTILVRGLARQATSVTRSELRVHSTSLLMGYD